MFSGGGLGLVDKLLLTWCEVCVSATVKPESKCAGFFSELNFFILYPSKCRVEMVPFNFSHFVLFAKSTICAK